MLMMIMMMITMMKLNYTRMAKDVSVRTSRCHTVVSTLASCHVYSRFMTSKPAYHFYHDYESFQEIGSLLRLSTIGRTYSQHHHRSADNQIPPCGSSGAWGGHVDALVAIWDFVLCPQSRVRLGVQIALAPHPLTSCGGALWSDETVPTIVLI